MRRQKKVFRERGFTLIEILLALSIFSTIALCIYGTFSGGIRLNQKSEQQNEVFREARWTFQGLSLELENMVSYDFTNSYPNKTAFSGSGEKITFISPSDEGLKVVSYYLMEPPREHVHTTVVGETYSKNVSIVTKYEESAFIYYLVREELSFVDYVNDRQAQASDIEIISTNVVENGLRFYYGYLKDEESQETVWQTDWSLGYIPSNIRIEIDFLVNEKKNSVQTLHQDVLVPAGFLGVEET